MHGDAIQIGKSLRGRLVIANNNLFQSDAFQENFPMYYENAIDFKGGNRSGIQDDFVLQKPLYKGLSNRCDIDDSDDSDFILDCQPSLREIGFFTRLLDLNYTGFTNSSGIPWSPHGLNWDLYKEHRKHNANENIHFLENKMWG